MEYFPNEMERLLDLLKKTNAFDDEVIADNEHFKASLVRYIFLVDSLTYAYQLEIENKLNHDINVQITNALADGNDVTEIVSLITGNSANLEGEETVYETIVILGFDEEITNIDELKVEFEVTDLGPDSTYETLGVYELLFDYE